MADKHKSGFDRALRRLPQTFCYNLVGSLDPRQVKRGKRFVIVTDRYTVWPLPGERVAVLSICFVAVAITFSRFQLLF